MAKFFESPVVSDALAEIVMLQEQILIFATYADYATIEDQWENLHTLRALSEKQKNMCFRCMLSDDDDAKSMLVDVLSHFEEFGHNVDIDNPMLLFDEVSKNLDDLEESLRYGEEQGYL